MVLPVRLDAYFDSDASIEEAQVKIVVTAKTGKKTEYTLTNSEKRDDFHTDTDTDGNSHTNGDTKADPCAGEIRGMENRIKSNGICTGETAAKRNKGNCSDQNRRKEADPDDPSQYYEY